MFFAFAYHYLSIQLYMIAEFLFHVDSFSLSLLLCIAIRYELQ